MKQNAYLVDLIFSLEYVEQKGFKKSQLQEPDKQFHQKSSHPRSYYTTSDEQINKTVSALLNYIKIFEQANTDQNFTFCCRIIFT